MKIKIFLCEISYNTLLKIKILCIIIKGETMQLANTVKVKYIKKLPDGSEQIINKESNSVSVNIIYNKPKRNYVEIIPNPPQIRQQNNNRFFIFFALELILKRYFLFR